ncbi:MAG: PAS domain-containing protein [Bacteroidales bacterium]|nr:PAS domain-containing protein [Bacteroidales bacterium]
MKFQNISDSEFAERIMNSLPGIFYLYEKVGDQVLLKNWNTNHVKDLGYSHEKLLNMNGSEFFTEQEFKRVAKAIEKVFSKGTNQIQTKIVTKSGKQVPYLLEAFSFVDNDRYYFMGVGIDITSQLKRLKKILTKPLVNKKNLNRKKLILLSR